MKLGKKELAEVETILDLSLDSKNTDICFLRVLSRLFGQKIDSLERALDIIGLSQKSANSFIEKLKLLQAQVCTESPKCANCQINKYCAYYRNFLQKKSSNKYTFVDLFCGAGGLSLGFEYEDFSLSLANDIQQCCIDTFIFNHPHIPSEHIVCDDIDNLLVNISDKLRYKHTDVVIGGPPCQGFSMANRQRLIDDPRNHLYKSFISAVEVLSPKFIVMENVKGMLGVADQVVEDFYKIGYDVSFEVLNAKDYGVPQNRERIIFIGNHCGINNNNIFKELHKISKVSKPMMLGDALYALRPLEALRLKNSTRLDTEESGGLIEKNGINESSEYIKLINSDVLVPFVYNHKARYNNDRDIEIFSRLNQGDRSDDHKIADIMPYATRNHIFKDKYFKLETDKICKTITAHMKFDCNMYIHPSQARGLTPREAARVQSYPDNYFFKGAYTKTYMQIGNSVPPLFSRAVARSIKSHLDV